MSIPKPCVVDTNVASTASGLNADASPDALARCARALKQVMAQGGVVIDDADLIMTEYRRVLMGGNPSQAGYQFLMWMIKNSFIEGQVDRVKVTPREDDPECFDELPPRPDGSTYDRSDQKFLAVAATHSGKPPVLQALDSKWWGWQEDLKAIGVSIHFLCPEEIQALHTKKMGP